MDILNEEQQQNLSAEEKAEKEEPEVVDSDHTAENSPEHAGGEQYMETTETSTSGVQSSVDETDGEFTALVADFTSELKETNRISQERELVIDRLHRENQQLKQGELQQALLPIFRDLIRFYDDLRTTVIDYTDTSEITKERILKDLECYGDTVGDILYRYGIEQIEIRSGEDFNPKEHKAVATVSTEVGEQDRKIAKIIRNGFRSETKIVRNVDVEVYRYVAPAIEKITEQSENTSGATENESEVK